MSNRAEKKDLKEINRIYIDYLIGKLSLHQSPIYPGSMS